MVRAFVAITLPDEALDALITAQAYLPAGRMIPRENMHLTLVFLDDQPMELLEALHEELERLKPPEFTLSLSGYGGFGNDLPKLVFADVVANPALSALQKSVVSATRRAGIALGKRRFIPHVTLARFNAHTGADRTVPALLQSLPDLRCPDFPVRSISLFKSDLYADGPIYHELAKYEFD